MLALLGYMIVKARVYYERIVFSIDDVFYFVTNKNGLLLCIVQRAVFDG